jgi:hypothetical protein
MSGTVPPHETIPRRSSDSLSIQWTEAEPQLSHGCGARIVSRGVGAGGARGGEADARDAIVRNSASLVCNGLTILI